MAAPPTSTPASAQQPLHNTAQRAQQLQRLRAAHVDVAVVGGGINGAATAAALAANGLQVALLERDDFAAHTSQASSNLVWGGIKYLENGELGLVWQLCRARNRLLRAYPTQVRQIDFLAVLHKRFVWPKIAVYLGTWLYWLLGRGMMPSPRLWSARRLANLQPAVDATSMQGAVCYTDAYLPENDARFVWGFIARAQSLGAVCCNYMSVKQAVRAQDAQKLPYWQLTASDRVSKTELTLSARVLVNAAGPFADAFNQHTRIRSGWRHVFAKGIHLIVPRLHQQEQVLTFFDETGRMFFVIPMGVRSVIGTTDTRVAQPQAHVTDDDVAFVLRNVNRYLNRNPPLTAQDVLAKRCGVRPLVVKNTQHIDSQTVWTQLSRKHILAVEPGYIGIYGGKLTDCINIGREVVQAVRAQKICDFAAQPAQTAVLGRKLGATRLGLCVRGLFERPANSAWFGEPDSVALADYQRRVRRLGLDIPCPGLPGDTQGARLWRRYGQQAQTILSLLEAQPQLAQPLVPELPYLHAEAIWAGACEMVVSVEDFVRRRTALAQQLSAQHIEQLAPKIAALLWQHTPEQQRVLQYACA